MLESVEASPQVAFADPWAILAHSDMTIVHHGKTLWPRTAPARLAPGWGSEPHLPAISLWNPCIPCTPCSPCSPCKTSWEPLAAMRI